MRAPCGREGKTFRPALNRDATPRVQGRTRPAGQAMSDSSSSMPWPKGWAFTNVLVWEYIRWM